MTHTRKHLQSFGKGFRTIGDYICYPNKWAKFTDCASKNQSNDDQLKCLAKTPVCVIGTAVTGPTGLLVGAGFGLLCAVSTPVVTLYDLPECCSDDKPPTQKM